jgi:hypothetical protein
MIMVSGSYSGHWMWTNMAMAGAWQYALGFSGDRRIGCDLHLRFTIVRPLIAGLFLRTRVRKSN